MLHVREIFKEAQSQMTRQLVPAILAAMLAVATGASAQQWERYESADGSFFIEHPPGWQVHETDEVITIVGDARQIAVISVPYNEALDARGHAQLVMQMLEASNPGLEADNWQLHEEGTVAYAQMRFAADGVPQDADVVVVTDPESQTVLWFSFSGPAAAYDREEAMMVLERVMVSIGGGLAGEPGTPAGPEAQTGPAASGVDAVIGAFIFVLEFAVGEQLGVAGEQMIAAELGRAWAEQGGVPDEMMMYPELAGEIMRLDQAELAGLQLDLQQAVTEWLEGSAADDPVVGLVRERINSGRQIVAGGEPQLSASAAQSYAEMLAFSELLHAQPRAGVGQLQPEIVEQVRGQLIAEWAGLSADSRTAVLSAPAVWGVLRHAVRLGDSQDGVQARAILAALTATGTAAPGQAQYVRSLIAEETLRQARQQTFNTWRWSMGYARTPLGY